MNPRSQTHVLLAGGAGLVGQNLVPRLQASGYTKLTVLDKNEAHLAVMRDLHPNVALVHADLAEIADWQACFAGADALVMLQAQITGVTRDPFVRNNIVATKNVLDAVNHHKVPYVVHVSSSVVNSVAEDFYTETKRGQERMVLGSGTDCVVLRPTVMFGWFDRKHFGWLCRFMQRVPVFPIPGDGRYARQPLYVADFCDIVIKCLDRRITGETFNITGLERIDYIDIIRQIKRTVRARCAIVCIPYRLFFGLLKVYSAFDRSPPFTADQLEALSAGDEFEVIDWETAFNVHATPFKIALQETFGDPVYSHLRLGL